MKNRRNKHFETPDALRHDVHTLTEDAEALLDATKEVVDEKVKAARTRLTLSVQRSRDLCADLQQKALDGAKFADETIHAHPYQAALIALGVGAFVGFLCRGSARHAS